MKIIPVEETDLSEVRLLIDESQLNPDGLEQHFSHFLKLILDDDMVAVAGLEVYGQIGLLRSVAVIDEYRNSGLGRGLTKAIINKARAMGIVDLYVCTETAAEFFTRFGFRKTDLADIAPALMQQSLHLVSIYSESSTLMHLKL